MRSAGEAQRGWKGPQQDGPAWFAFREQAGRMMRRMSDVLALSPTSVGQRIAAGFVAIAAGGFSAAALVASWRGLRAVRSAEFVSFVGSVGPFVFLALGVAGLWFAWSLRLHFLPFRLCVDKVRRVAYAAWGPWRTRVIPLDGASAILVTPAFADNYWAYALFALTADGREYLCRSKRAWSLEAQALATGAEEGRLIARHLSVPLKFEDWSEALLAEVHSESRVDCRSAV